MEVDFPDGTKRLHLSDLWESAQEFAEAACERATSSSGCNSKTNNSSNNQFGMFFSEILDRAFEAYQSPQDSSVDPEQRPKPG
ncbi:MAG: hypothetical protein OSA98_09045 [Rubripirellula sp.]|nr:hypothetical protein [Rubripirellula sp.]